MFIRLRIIRSKNKVKMSRDIIRAVDLDVNTIQYGELKKRGSNAKAPKGVDMTINNKPIILQIPNAKVPFGLNQYTDDKTSETKYSLEISLGGSDDIEEFKAVLEELNDLNVKTIAENSKEWLGNKMKADTIREAGNYTSLVRPDKADNPPRFKTKLPVYLNRDKDRKLVTDCGNGRGDFVVFNKGSKDPLDIVKRDSNGYYNTDFSWANNGMEVTLIVQCEGLWVINKNVYCTWKVLQIKINKKSSKMITYAFADSDDEDNDEGEDDNNGDVEENGDDEEEDYIDGDE